MAPEAGLYYMRNRWYETRTGRFISEDPMGLAAGINLYSFVGADPLNDGDPTGLGPDDECWPYPFPLVGVYCGPREGKQGDRTITPYDVTNGEQCPDRERSGFTPCHAVREDQRNYLSAPPEVDPLSQEPVRACVSRNVAPVLVAASAAFAATQAFAFRLLATGRQALQSAAAAANRLSQTGPDLREMSFDFNYAARLGRYVSGMANRANRTCGRAECGASNRAEGYCKRRDSRISLGLGNRRRHSCVPRDDWRAV